MAARRCVRVAAPPKRPGELIVEQKLADVGTKKLHEDERCIVWELRLEPGQAEKKHRHNHDYIMIIVEGDRIAAHFDKESVGAFAEYAGRTLERDVKPGTVVPAKKGSIEVAENTGKKVYRNFIIEFKD
jgi:hypothetical protein